MSKIKDELTFRHAVDEVMERACRIAAVHLSVLKKSTRRCSQRVSASGMVSVRTSSTFTSPSGRFSDDLLEGGVFGVVMRDFPWVFTGRQFDTAGQVRDTVRWRAMAIDKVDSDALTFEVSDLDTGETFTLHVDERLAARRTCDHQGTLSGFVATVDGVTSIVGPSSYDIAPAGSNEIWRRSPLFLNTAILSGAINATVLPAE